MDCGRERLWEGAVEAVAQKGERWRYMCLVSRLHTVTMASCRHSECMASWSSRRSNEWSELSYVGEWLALRVCACGVARRGADRASLVAGKRSSLFTNSSISHNPSALRSPCYQPRTRSSMLLHLEQDDTVWSKCW